LAAEGEPGEGVAQGDAEADRHDHGPRGDREAVDQPAERLAVRQRLAEDAEPAEVGEQAGPRGEQLGVRRECGDEHPVEGEHRDAEGDEDPEDAQDEARRRGPVHDSLRSATRATARLAPMTVREMRTPTIPIAAAVPSCCDWKAWE